MFYLIYNALSLFLLLPATAYHTYRSISRKRPPALRQRFGYIKPDDLKKINSRPVILLHAVSVGEAIASRPLLKALRQRYPDHAIVISTTTETGRNIASAFGEKDICVYFPFDFLPAVRKTLDNLKPVLIIIMETEIWPNFTREAHRRGIKMVLANGRISDRSFKGYLRFSWFFRNALQYFSVLCMQSLADAERITAIGAPAERVIISGNLKYDIPLRTVQEQEKKELRQRYAIPQTMMVLTAASTHSGEDELIIDAYLKLLTNNKNLFLTLVPRHPERCGEVATLLEKNSFGYCRRTKLDSREIRPFVSGEVLLIDTIGEMMNIYAFSDLVFVGGSLVPIGGHNPLEPASVGVPSVFGPFMDNFREIADLVRHYEAGRQINGPDQLSSALRDMIERPNERETMGANGLRMMRENGGATEKHMNMIGRYL